MADQIPQFLTGAQATIKIVDSTTGSTTLAYCTDVSYNVSVQHIPVEALGQFKVYSNEPVSYTANGSFSVIRYKVGTATNVTGVPADNQEKNIANQMIPGKILESKTFDLEIYAKFSIDGAAEATDQVIIKLVDCRITSRSQQLNKRSLMVDTFQFVAIGVDDATTVALDVQPTE